MFSLEDTLSRKISDDGSEFGDYSWVRRGQGNPISGSSLSWVPGNTGSGPEIGWDKEGRSGGY